MDKNYCDRGQGYCTEALGHTHTYTHRQRGLGKLLNLDVIDQRRKLKFLFFLQARRENVQDTKHH